MIIEASSKIHKRVGALEGTEGRVRGWIPTPALQSQGPAGVQGDQVLTFNTSETFVA